MSDKTPKIEQGIPIPKERRFHRGKWKELLEQMQVGDSFALDAHTANIVRFSISQHKKRNKPKKDWTVLKVGPTEWRCWRTK